ncbi:molybdate transporter 1-like protein [Trifolium pratense]|uniref:Molybdate transporter 1-like protein n=1 Tax=Trifolium pratense TaxID=57577 RepID=A0A2K3MRB7_TRIPR|nr:molybdate transporter 1-like protein [Trifolium pratense]
MLPTITTTPTRLTTIQKVKSNLLFRSTLSELNGAMGDLGTYIPIVLSLTLSKNLNLGTTLIFTGFYNFLTGAMYGVPMPVQPMKSIAAVALSDPSFGIPEIMASGILTGGILLVLGFTGLMKLAYKLIPLCVVRGIQLAQGLSFALTAIKYVRKVQDLPKSKSLNGRDWFGFDGLVIAIVCVFFVVVVNGAGEKEHEFDEIEEELGGLAGQYKFGGRSGGCVAILGAAKLVLGFVLGSSLAHFFQQFPVGILGVLLLFAGIELAMACRDMNNKEDSFVMLLCTAVSLVGSSAALGFLCGMVVFGVLKVRNLTSVKSLSSIWKHEGQEQV